MCGCLGKQLQYLCLWCSHNLALDSLNPALDLKKQIRFEEAEAWTSASCGMGQVATVPRGGISRPWKVLSSILLPKNSRVIDKNSVRGLECYDDGRLGYENHIILEQQAVRVQGIWKVRS